MHPDDAEGGDDEESRARGRTKSGMDDLRVVVDALRAYKRHHRKKQGSDDDFSEDSSEDSSLQQAASSTHVAGLPLIDPSADAMCKTLSDIEARFNAFDRSGNGTYILHSASEKKEFEELNRSRSEILANLRPSAEFVTKCPDIAQNHIRLHPYHTDRRHIVFGKSVDPVVLKKEVKKTFVDFFETQLLVFMNFVEEYRRGDYEQ